MSVLDKLMLGCVACVVMFCFVSPTTTVAQANKPAESVETGYDRTLRQLLAEVRELRLAVQRATVTHTRFQIMIERVRIQQSHVDTSLRQIENLRSQIADLRSAKPQMEQQIKDAEELMERTTDPNGRGDIEHQIKAMKGQLARFATEEERLRTREASLETELQASQAKLNELNSQLDALLNEMKVP